LGNDGDSCFTLPGVRYGAILLVARFLGLIPPAAFSLDLDTARSKGYIDYTWYGSGSSNHILYITNRTKRIWIVEVEVATKLEPAGDNVQSMVVTEEVRVKLHPHDRTTLEVKVACPDIEKPPRTQHEQVFPEMRTIDRLFAVYLMTSFLPFYALLPHLGQKVKVKKLPGPLSRAGRRAVASS